jgi:alkylation response protein AidB-like acyl-CoA dehydrogenase
MFQPARPAGRAVPGHGVGGSPAESVIRRNDYSLDPQQNDLAEAFARFFRKECPSTRVRQAEPLGFDEDLWRTLQAMDVIPMGAMSAAGDGGACLVDLVLVAEQYGRYLAPVPLVEALVAIRALSQAGTVEADAAATEMTDAGALFTVALSEFGRGERQLVPAAAIADGVIALDAGDLVLLTPGDRPAHAANHASSPVAWFGAPGPGCGRAVLSRGSRARELFEAVQRDWLVLTAAALAGLGDGAVQLAVDFAKVRQAFGVPIAAFQAVAHPLVDAATAVEGARNLTRKAAWFASHEPPEARTLVPMAYLHAVRSASLAAGVGIHVQGGFGLTLESDQQLYFRRSRGWPVLKGDPASELRPVADMLRAGWTQPITR